MRKKVPGYLNHKSRNLAKVVIDGRTIYLGEYGSSESHEVYQRVIAEWLAAKEALDAEREPLTVNGLCDAFWGFGLDYYGDEPRGTLRNLTTRSTSFASVVR